MASIVAAVCFFLRVACIVGIISLSLNWTYPRKVRSECKHCIRSGSGTIIIYLCVVADFFSLSLLWLFLFGPLLLFLFWLWSLLCLLLLLLIICTINDIWQLWYFYCVRSKAERKLFILEQATCLYRSVIGEWNKIWWMKRGRRGGEGRKRRKKKER